MLDVRGGRAGIECFLGAVEGHGDYRSRWSPAIEEDESILSVAFVTDPTPSTWAGR